MHTMADIEPNWEWYRSFVCVLDTGSLSAAGRAMGLTQPTVGRHIDSLESALGLKLFTRSFDGFAPTDAALELKPYATALASSAAAPTMRAVRTRLQSTGTDWTALNMAGSVEEVACCCDGRSLRIRRAFENCLESHHRYK